MVFSSLEFLFLYLPVTLLFYFMIPPKYLKWRNLELLIMSLIFYGWGEPVYMFLMIFTIIIDYIGGFLVAKYLDTNKKKSKAWMIATIVVNLLILGFFKYYNFFVENINPIVDFAARNINHVIDLMAPVLEKLHLPSFYLATSIPVLENLRLPIGISFYTFQSLSYVIDVYRRDARVQKDLPSFGAYVTLFPQLIAGPIVRYQDVDDMLRERDENVALFASGIRTFLAGFGKKIFFANVAGQMWETYRALPADDRTVFGCWIAMICYMFQIYFDFSGYSDMAIGLGKMVGFRFLENFNYPYVATSINDFWRRWHISLTTWFREYIYFPLGGSRVDKQWKQYRNMFIVWFCTGFWHGASWNYILWGMYYFVLQALEKAFLGKWLEKTPKFFQHLYTLFFVLFGWLLFTFEDLGAGMAYMGNMFGVGMNTFINTAALYDFLRNLVFFIILVIACTPYPKKLFYKLYEKHGWARCAAYVGGVLVLLTGVAYLVDSSFNPFLYFRF